ncbi:hypothetical protein BLS_009713 [Venturia inaequalis]|uniref:Uncharacterized protein n=1 Tax=Venturia inaequalis TaxID=5025 RepID=A0A8H3U9Q6_VENIN|nr:hypothetical protein BLS_009713 [Venturia inaequalis]KAE9964744.1 hypothetical protein EG328_010220 [Venturia inaequalis]KAE9989753.1 hypothetical protein EG327_002302 [Venturia inaequalis]RDI84292.1 hypothetical protein Vi05172_g5714 [Venturia inaequalis]
MAPQEYPQPFPNRPETFAYIPRRNGDPSVHQMHAQLQQPHPAPQPQVYYYPAPQPYFMPHHAYAVPQQPVYHPGPAGPAYYYPQPHYYPWYPGYGPQAAAHAAQPSQPAPAQPAQPAPLRLADGRLPFYGRTPQEVSEDAIKVARAHDKSELHTFAPTAEPSTKFWCKMPDSGDYKMLPLGTINLTWKGDWCHDAIHDRVYFVATELK